ncbi:serine hydrolase domain-containing protein [Pararhodobacter sp. SW119]|uniref:serine hydrolase domain-containing protein n=1 Tax=Pararhodobacter sp. SW119 TaxID=2780075 RepID=UPI001ADFC221|nr:serine hydrolase domain-containing protein [Pararhodobacter sp. SW119]
MTNLTVDLVQAQAGRMCRSRHVYGAVLAVHHAPENARCVAAAGDLRPESRFFAASVTKLVITIVVMRMVERGQLALDDPMARYLPADLIAGLHVMRGVDRTGQITIRHLISSQTGLRDSFSLKGPDGRSHMAALMAGEDSAWPLERTLEAVRGLPARFAPGAPGKVNYSDTNYQLLGRILETVSGKDLPRLLANEVFAPLGLRDTYI